MSERGTTSRRGIKIIEVMAIIAGFAVLLFFLKPAVIIMSAEHRPSPRMQCGYHLKQIGLALFNYQAAYGCYPPAYVADASGKPMHSWRVLILPFLEQQSVYDQYRFDEPWDGPHNRKLWNGVMEPYSCHRHPDMGPATAFLAVLGPQTAWPGSQSVAVKDITDGPDLTIQVVEVASDTIHWMEPRDLHLDAMDLRINGKGGVVGPSSPHPGGANFLFADGSVRFLKNSMTPRSLRALLTIRGHEQVDTDSY